MQAQHERDTEMKLKLGINFASGTRISGYIQWLNNFNRTLGLHPTHTENRFDKYFKNRSFIALAMTWHRQICTLFRGLFFN
jgi:hypothetical protein